MKKFRLLFSDFIATVKSRWRNHMPRFFRRVFWVCSLISGTSLAVNTAITMGGGYTHQWWQDIYPYLLGVPAGMAFVCKFTQQYHGKPVGYDEYKHTSHAGRTILDHDLDHLDGIPPECPPHHRREERPTVPPSESSSTPPSSIAATPSGETSTTPAAPLEEKEMFEIEPYDDSPNA